MTTEYRELLRRAAWAIGIAAGEGMYNEHRFIDQTGYGYLDENPTRANLVETYGEQAGNDIADLMEMAKA